MNERIKQLAEKASKDNEHGYPVTLEYTNRFAQKLAELIVQECIQVCKSRVGNSDYTTGRMHCVSDLKEHFGVKE
jgi:hypothetical protein